MRTLTQFLTGNINEGRFEKNKKTLGLFFAWYFSSNAKSAKNWKNVDKKWAKEILSWDERDIQELLIYMQVKREYKNRGCHD